MAKKSSTVHKGQVKLREKKLANGGSSLYLDILNDGKRHKEYLKLYLIPARTAAEREQNKQTLSVANAMRSRRQLEIINGEYDIAMPKKAEVYFLDYFLKAFRIDYCLASAERHNKSLINQCLKIVYKHFHFHFNLLL